MTERNDQKIWQDTSMFLEVINKGSRKVAIITHLNPDGDAIGSSLGFLRTLTNMGHQCTAITPNPYPDFLRWLPGADAILVFDEEKDRAAQILKQSEIIVSIDFNTLRRIKQFHKLVDRSTAYKLLIDHHPDPDFFADCTLSDTSVSSSAEIVYHFIKSAGLTRFLDVDAATCFITGIMSDTGCFSYNSSSRKTYEIVAELLDFRINKDRIYALLYDNFSANRMRLLGYSLNEKMEVMPECRTAFIWLTRDELERYQFRTGDSEGFVNYPLSIQGIRFSALFIEKEDQIRVSLRSKGNFSVNRFAEKYFNGGGHMNAAGGESFESMEKTLQYFRQMVMLHKDSLNDYEI